MDASVEFLLGNLKEVLVYQYNLLRDVENEIQQINDEFNFLNAILKDLSGKPNHPEIIRLWEKEIREVVYDVEDTIHSYITQLAAEKATETRSIYFLPFMKKRRVNLAEKIKKLREVSVRPLLRNIKFVMEWIAAPAETRALKKKRTKNIIGFQDEATTLIHYLSEESDKLKTIAITGMPGLGKTTLAWKIFEDPSIVYEFPVRIWVNISEDLNMRNVLLTILRRFTASQPDAGLSDKELVGIVRKHLKEERFLIVMDDVWTPTTWENIRYCLPMDNKLGRVVITTRSKNVALYASPLGKPHSLCFLNESESWELLQYKVYGKPDLVPKELVKVGQAIAEKCNGFPPSIIVIADILLSKISSAGGQVASIRKEWNEVAETMETYLFEDMNNPLGEILSHCYSRDLPYELRNCFLYFGMFPKAALIPIKKLIRLWIAEGFIQESIGKSLEQIAKDNLRYLINRNLVMVKEEKSHGKAKICYIHSAIHGFCKTKSAFNNLNLFQEITKSSQGYFEPSIESIGKCRRLCIRSHVTEFLLGKPTVRKVRSFLCFTDPPVVIAPSHVSSATDGFDQLRVYSAENIRFSELPLKLLQLIHLRYLTLALANDRCKTLPAVISKLWNLQTLIVDIPSPTLGIQASILRLRQLRHLQTNASIILKNVDDIGEGGDNLQTLGRLLPESCNEKVFDKAKNLIALGIQGDLSSTQLESRGLEKLVLLNKLKLVHMVTGKEASENPMPCLPGNNKFPPNLKVLVLVGTYLEWEQMAILGGLNNLEELKLKDNACRGESWDVNGGFKRLELLHVERSSDLKYWSILDDAFPELRYLLLNYCERLVEVPFALGRELELLCMKGVTEEAIMCAEKIEKKRKGAKGCVKFKLDIAPGDRTRKDC